jgi:hypothetical protein
VPSGRRQPPVGDRISVSIDQAIAFTVGMLIGLVTREYVIPPFVDLLNSGRRRVPIPRGRRER